MIALLSSQETACAEAALCKKHDTPSDRQMIESAYCRNEVDAPIAGTWTDVTDNDVVDCAICGDRD